MEVERRVAVMGTEANILVIGAEADTLAHLAVLRLGDLEARWSRFREDSEISGLNRAGGAPVVVSAWTVGLVERAVRGALQTDGRFDPTVLGAVVRAGYDRSFEALADPDGGVPGRAMTDGTTGAAGIEVDPVTNVVRLPAGVGFDPGGIGKGYAADLVATELMAAGADGVLVDVGGDLRVAGTPRFGDRWRIDVLDPFDPFEAATIATLGVGTGAVATSTRLRRVWSKDGRPAHHLIDPATGVPAANGIAAVTVIASEGWRAEVLAKSAFMAGPLDAADALESLGVSGLVVTDTRHYLPIGAWESFVPALTGVER